MAGGKRIADELVFLHFFDSPPCFIKYAQCLILNMYLGCYNGRQDHGIPYDELFFGKPWGHFYIDDLAVCPVQGGDPLALAKQVCIIIKVGVL